jgi:cation diffusion facilitator family transporter
MQPTNCSQAEFYQGHMFHENERRMRWVVVLTFVMMIGEVFSGLWFGSMALLADGFHMATHVGALGISVFAYSYARHHMHDPRYSFGTGKVGDLAGFTSALILVAIAFYVLFESVHRLLVPITIVYGEASVVAVLGLAVNAVSALILRGSNHDHHAHSHDHAEHDHAHHHDSNFQSAYLHIVADGVTSFLAIFALLGGWAFGWGWMDPAVGIIGAVVILSWAWSLIRDASGVLLDRVPQAHTAEQMRTILAQRGAQITDMHLWRVGPGANAVIVALSVTQPVTPQDVREWLHPLGLAHMTIEINVKN